MSLSENSPGSSSFFQITLAPVIDSESGACTSYAVLSCSPLLSQGFLCLIGLSWNPQSLEADRQAGSLFDESRGYGSFVFEGRTGKGEPVIKKTVKQCLTVEERLTVHLQHLR